MSNRRIGKIAPVVLAGGFGTRLFPNSTRDLPKQFIKHSNGLSLFQGALSRANDIGTPLIVGNAHHKHLIRTQTTTKCTVMLEPVSRNTAVATTIAALYLRDHGYDTAIICPSDHIIYETAAFQDAIIQVTRRMKRYGGHGLFGVTPTSVSTDYGYIQTDEFGTVTLFKEKPNVTLAQNLLDDTTRTYWNSGITCLDIASFFDEMTAIAPDFLALCHRAYHIPTEAHYAAIPAIPFDQLYLEHAPHLFCIEAPFDWQDVGTPQQQDNAA